MPQGGKNQSVAEGCGEGGRGSLAGRGRDRMDGLCVPAASAQILVHCSDRAVQREEGAATVPFLLEHTAPSSVAYDFSP